MPAVRGDLGDFVEAARQVPELDELLRNPQLDKRAKAAAVDAVAGGGDPLVLNLLRLLVEKGRGGEVEQVADEFERMAAAEEGELSVELTTAYELSDEEARAIVGQIEQRSGRKVEANRDGRPRADRRHGPPGRLARGSTPASAAGSSSSAEISVTRCHDDRRSPELKLRPEEITALLKERIKEFDVETDLAEVGQVLQVGDGIARVYGLESAVALEMLELEHGVTGVALNLEEDNVGAALLGEWEKVKEGEPVRRTGRVASVPVGDDAGRPHRRPARQPGRRQPADRGRRAPAARVQGARRRPAPAGEGAAPDRA